MQVGGWPPGCASVQKFHGMEKIFMDDSEDG